jgi:hypothetical protein
MLPSATVPVSLRNCTIAIDRGAPMPLFEITEVDLDFTQNDAAVDFSGTLAALGNGSHGDLTGTWRPKAGRTGGDGLKMDLKVRDGRPEALFAMIPLMRTEPFKGPIRFELTADGFIGERTTEAQPAEPLLGTMRAETDFDLFGLTKRAVFENGFAFDDRRLALREGKGNWGDYPFTYSGWIARGYADNKVNLKLDTGEVDVDELLAEYDIPERWRPEATVSAEVRMGGTLTEDLVRYEAKSPSAKFNGFPSVPISAGKFTVGGSLLAVNAEVAGSFMFDELRVGHVVFKNQLVGSRWWRNELGITSLGQKLWDGKLDAAGAWKPNESKDVTGGGVFYDVDVAKLLADVVPDLGVALTGRLDMSTTAVYDARGFGYEGRGALFYGVLGPDGWMRKAVDQVLAAVGADVVNEEIETAYPVLELKPVPFDRVEAIFQSRDDGIAFAILDGKSKGATYTLDGKSDLDRKITADAVIVLTPDLVSTLIARAPALAGMADPGGSLAVPVHLEGKPADIAVSLDRNFAAALTRAKEGEPVDAPAVTPREPSFTTDIPALQEQFGR